MLVKKKTPPDEDKIFAMKVRRIFVFLFCFFSDPMDVYFIGTEEELSH